MLRGLEEDLANAKERNCCAVDGYRVRLAAWLESECPWFLFPFHALEWITLYYIL